MASRIKLKSSTTPNSVPQISDLSDREVALNINDRTLFVNDNGTIREVLNADPNDETIVPAMLSSSITDGVGNTWYVSENGTDKATIGSVNPRHGSTTGANAWGKTPTTAFATLKYALTYAQAEDIIFIEAGTYTEEFPLTVPVDVSIKGRGIKSVFIQPTVGTNDQDAFRIEGNCNIEDLTVRNFYYDSINDTGYGFRLASGFTITERRPYIQRVSVLTKGSVTSASDPRGYNQGDAGRGALVDGSVANSSTIEASLLFNECTFVVPNSVGLYLKNGARCEWLNSFTYYAQDGIIGENPSGGTGLAGVARTRLNLEGESGSFAAGGGNTIGLLDENASNVSTTYTSSGVDDNLTVIISSASHGLSLDDIVYVTFTSGNQSGVAVFATVTDVPTADSFEISGVYAGVADIGSVTYRVAKAYGAINENDGTYVYISGQGFGRFEAVDETTGKTVSANGNVVTSTAQAQLGSSSAFFDGSGDWLQIPSSPDFNFSTGDFTLEAFVRLNNISGNKVIFDLRASSLTEISPVVYVSGTDIIYYVNGSAAITGAGALTANTWYHIAVSRSGQQSRLFVNGSQVGSTYTDANDFPTRAVRIGSNVQGSATMNGYIDEVRISKGTSKYNGTFTPTTTQFVADEFTALLLHMEGSNGQSVFVDDSIVSQEIVSTAGGTATFITLADYTKFGAELRSISSANVYGLRGATADGKGVSIRLVSHNFGYIGVGKEDNNDVSLVVQSNEVNEQNDGRIFFTSIDQSGDFRVGTLFLVDQEKGTLSFAGQGSGGGTGTSFDQLLVSAGSDTTTILPTSIEVGNFSFFGNTIGTNAGGINLTPFAGETVNLSSELLLKSFVGQEASKLSLAFDNDENTGIRKPSTDGHFTLVSNGSAVARVLPGEFRLSADTNISTSIADSVGFSNSGRDYPVGTWTGVPVFGGTGTGMTVDFTVTAFNGSITNTGSGYAPGTYSNVSLANVSSSGTGGQANITVKGIGGGTIVGGAGYTDETYSDVPLNGGTGTGALATIFVGGGAVTDVFITNEGDASYTAGNTLTINTADLTYIDGEGVTQTSGGAGFSYTVPSDLYSVSQVSPPTNWNGTGYVSLDTVTATLPGGSGFEFVFNQIQYISSVEITPDPANPDEDVIAGTGYELGDRVTPYYALTSNDTLLGAGYTVTYNVQVRNTAGGDRFFINTGSGYVETPDLTLDKETLYKFVFAPDGTYPGTYAEHPLAFSTTPDGTHSGGVAYTVLSGGLNGNNGAYIIVTENTPVTLYYYCPNHADMGGSAGNEATVDTSVDTVYGINGEFSIDSATLENFISLSKTGNIGAENLVLVQNASIEGNLTVLGTTTFTSATAQNLTVNGVLSASGGIGTSGNLSVAGDLGTSGRLTVSGDPLNASQIDGSVDFDTNLLLLDSINNKVSILGPTDNTIEDYTFEVNSTAKIYNHTFLASDTGSVVSIGLDPGSSNILSTFTEKFNVKGDSNFNGRILVFDGTETAPSITFDTDETLGFFKDSNNSITTVGYNGPITKQTTQQISFFKPVNLINKAIDGFTVTSGRGYVPGIYNNVLFRGGTGADFTADVTVAFVGNISVAGAGYTAETYEAIPVQYSSITSGAITLFGTLTPGSGYVDGTYQNVALTSGTGTSATADFTISSGQVTSVVINNKGANYSVSDLLGASTSNLGGSKLTGSLSINLSGSGYGDGSYTDVSLINVSGTGSGATADITVSGGVVTAAAVNASGGGYTTSDTFSVDAADLYQSNTYTLTVTDDGSNTNYVISGSDRTTTHSSANDPALNVNYGDTLVFNVNASGHPFFIVSQLDAQTGGYNNAFNVTATNNGTDNGTVTLDTSVLTAGSTYYYICENHGVDMQGTILVSNSIPGSGLELGAQTVSTGSGFSVRVNAIGSTGTGSGAAARVVIAGGSVTKFEITTPGSNYQIGDVLTVNYTDLTYIDLVTGLQETSTAPSTPVEYTVTKLNSVSYLNIDDLGAGYSPGDVLDLSSDFYDATALGFTLFPLEASVNAGQLFYAGEYTYEITSAGTTGTVVPSFGKDGVSAITTNNTGSGYPANATINSVSCESTIGSGTGLLVDIITNGAGAVTSITPSGNLSGDLFQVGDQFTLDNDYINTGVLTISISSGGDGGGYGDSQTYDLTQSATSGTGAGLQVRFTSDPSGNISSATILSNGIGYTVGELVEFDASLFGAGGGGGEEGEVIPDPVTVVLSVDSLTAGSGALFTVQSIASSVTNGSATISHNGYFPSGFALTVDTLAEFNNIQFDAVDGIVTAKKVVASPDGVEIGTTLILNNNEISTTSGNLTLSSETNSQVVIGGTGALALPVGSDSNRPGGPLQGSVRYNTDRNQFEGYNGNYFVSLGGVRDVDGNTFIIGEKSPGNDDNNIWFYNNGTQTLRVGQTNLNLDTLNTINSNAEGNSIEWTSETAVTQFTADTEGNLTVQQYIISGDNLYKITADHTTGTVAPTHTSGIVANLEFTSYRYDDLVVNTDNLNLGVRTRFSINNNALSIVDFGNRESIKTGRDSLTIGFNPFSTDSYDLLKLTDGGALQINRGFSSTSDNYLTVLDANLQKLELANTKIFTQTSNLDASAGNVVTATMFPWAEAWSGKFMVEIEEQFPIPSAYPRKQYSEISYLVKGNGEDIIYTESNKLYTDVVLADVEADLSGSNIQVRVTELGSATDTFIPVAAERSADITSSTFFTQNITSVYDSNADRIVVFTNDASNRNIGGFRVGTVSDGEIIFGTQIPYTTALEQDSSTLLFDSTTNRIVLINEGGALVGEVNPGNSTITFGSPISPFNHDAYNPNTDINRNKTVQATMVDGRVVMVYGFTSNIYVRSGAVTGGATNSISYVNHGAIGGSGVNTLRTITSDNNFLYLIFTTSSGDKLQKWEVTPSSLTQEWTNSQISDRSAQKLVAGGGRLLRVSDGSVAGTLEAQIYDPTTGSQLGTTLVMNIDSKIFDVAYDSINNRYMLVAALDYSNTNDAQQNLMGVINVDGNQLSFTANSTKYSALDQPVDQDRTAANAGDVDALFVGTRSDGSGDLHQIFVTSASTSNNISVSTPETVSFASAIENRTTYNIKIVSHTVKR